MSDIAQFGRGPAHADHLRHQHFLKPRRRLLHLPLKRLHDLPDIQPELPHRLPSYPAAAAI